MRPFAFKPLLGLAALLALGATAAPAQAHGGFDSHGPSHGQFDSDSHGHDRSDSDGPSRVVYVESNIGDNDNSILAFSRGEDGQLTPLSGSPFATGGSGVVDTSLQLGPFDSDQNIIANSEHTLLFAVNSGSNSIAVFHIEANGALDPVDGSPFPSRGINPVSLGLSNNILCVVNKDQDPAQDTSASLPNYTTFRVTRSGRLIPIPYSTIRVAPGSSPSQALVSPNKRELFGADFMSGLMQSFFILPNGHLYQNTPQPLPDSVFAGTAAPHFPLGMTANPGAPALYVGLVTINKMAVYAYNYHGELTFIRTVSNSGQGICWLISNKAGTRVYTTNTGDNSVSVYDTTSPFNPKEIQHLTLVGDAGGFQLALDSQERYIYVVNQRDKASIPLGSGNVLHVLKVNNADGTVSEVASSPTTLPVPVGVRPQGVVAL